MPRTGIVQLKPSKESFLLLLVLCVTVVYLALRSEARIFLNSAEVTVRNEGDAVALVWRSAIEAPMARKLEAAFGEVAGRTGHVILDLNSPGGAVVEGGEVIDLVSRMRRTHRVDTRVRAGRSCFSMCVPVFLAGEERIAARSSQFMFHEPTARDLVTGERVDEPGFERRISTTRFVERYFVNSPMAPAWRENLVAQWKGRDIYKSAKELVDEESGIVTRLE